MYVKVFFSWYCNFWNKKTNSYSWNSGLPQERSVDCISNIPPTCYGCIGGVRVLWAVRGTLLFSVIRAIKIFFYQIVDITFHFRGFNFTLKPPCTVVIRNLLLAIENTHFPNCFVIFPQFWNMSGLWEFQNQSNTLENILESQNVLNEGVTFIPFLDWTTIKGKYLSHNMALCLIGHAMHPVAIYVV